MKHDNLLHRLTRLTAAVALGGALGCTATITTTPEDPTVYSYRVVAVDSPPGPIYQSPRVDYHGSPAYLVGDRWYYQDRGRWVYFREEPPELHRARTRGEYRADSPPRRAPEAPTETRRRRYD
jgi:hypothetical protein